MIPGDGYREIAIAVVLQAMLMMAPWPRYRNIRLLILTEWHQAQTLRYWARNRERWLRIHAMLAR